MTEIGPLNQLMHLWSYNDLNERVRLRAELAKNKRWTSEYPPLTRPNLIRQEMRLLNPVDWSQLHRPPRRTCTSCAPIAPSLVLVVSG